jgi:NDP-sugar pyrophosphorylase family protein
MIALVFMVAGMSSRFNGKPKQMARVGPNNETLIEYSVNQALKQNFSKLIFITNSNTEYLFREIFKDKYLNREVLYIEQKYDKSIRTRPWGTTDAICSLIGKIEEKFILLLNGDDIYGESTFESGYKLLNDKKNNIIGGLPVIDTMPEIGEVNRGIFMVNDDEQVYKMKEFLNISKIKNPELMNNLANVNFIGLHYDTLLLLNDILIKFKTENKGNPKIECLLTDNINELIESNKITMDYFSIKNKIIGLTNPEDELIVKNILRSNREVL